MNVPAMVVFVLFFFVLFFVEAKLIQSVRSFHVRALL